MEMSRQGLPRRIGLSPSASHKGSPYGALEYQKITYCYRAVAPNGAECGKLSCKQKYMTIIQPLFHLELSN